MRFFFCLSVMLLSLSSSAWAGSYNLTYREKNRWVHQDDRKDLDVFIAMAKKDKASSFKVILPKNDRELQIERLIVIRDLLAKDLNTAVTIEEQAGQTENNKLIFSY